jgi:alpha-L-fucosidase
MTMGDFCGWGYIRNNPNYKPVSQLIQNLVIAAAGGGNYLLNIGPKPDGSVRKEESIRLNAVGEWLKKNGEAIYGCERCELVGGGISYNNIIPDWNMLGKWTAKGKNAYLCVFRWPGEEAVIPLVKTKVKSATLLASGKKLKVHQEYNGRLVIQGLPKAPPDPNVSVIKVEFASQPEVIIEKDKSVWLEGKL